MSNITIDPIELVTLKDLAVKILTMSTKAQSLQIHRLELTNMTPEALDKFIESTEEVAKNKGLRMLK